ncbi:hypothetical protein AC249_AIPGENE7126 [Exaiptasia diaphana]|nr:hypothetical protein AC249_AIPGENE7126 [Exaiptasia diaphana]
MFILSPVTLYNILNNLSQCRMGRIGNFVIAIIVARDYMGDSLTSYHVGQPFSTKDNDNDRCDDCSCSVQ